MKETSFTDKFYKKITNLCTNFKTDYIEYIQQRIQEQTNNSMAISSLKIAKSSRTASWFFGVVSTITAFASFYVSYLAYKK